MNELMGMTDRETTDDKLNIKGYVDGFVSFVSTCNTPMSIAVQGDWGTGKSSFMEMTARRFDENENVTVIRFNTWQYSRVEDERLFVPMLKVLMDDIDRAYLKTHPKGTSEGSDYISYFQKEEGKGFIRFNALQAVQRIASLASAYSGNGLVSLIAALLGYVPDSGEMSDTSDTYEEIVRIREKLQERIDVLTGAKTICKKELKVSGTGRTGRVLVFVDDLDRLRPASAVGLLEDMKNFMDCEGCVFVLALDHKLVQSGVKAKYGSDLDDTYARRFFEKIVQIPFYLPVNRYDIRGYIENLISEGGLAGYLDADECVKTVEQFTDGNPRVIKRTLNAFRMSLEMDPEITSRSTQRIFALLVLHAVNEDLYNEMVRVLDKIEVSGEMYFERTGFDLVPDKEWNRKHPGEWEKLEYIRQLYDGDDFGLREDIFRSTMLESGHFKMSDERDRVYNAVTDYLESKGMNKTESAGGRTVFVKGDVTIEVVRFDNAHANVNFTSLKGADAEEVLGQLQASGQAEQDPEHQTHYLLFRNDQERYIENDRCLYFRKVKFDRRAFLMIGDIVQRILP